MNVFNTIVVGLKEVWSHKFRSFLTMLGIILGVASLVAPLFLFVVTMAFLKRAYGLRMPRPIAARSAWLLVSLVACALMGALFRGSVAQSLALNAAIYGLVLGGFALLLSDHERRRIRETLAGLRARWM